MNEQIKRLALEARIAYYSKNGAYEGSDKGLSVIPSTQSLEKFAELLIRECLELCEDAQNGFLLHGMAEREAEGAIFVQEYIKEHFGVEE